jgi:5-methylcytosine-specific restriction protein A
MSRLADYHGSITVGGCVENRAFSGHSAGPMSVAATSMGVMNQPLSSLARDLHVLEETWAGALPAFGLDAPSSSSTQSQLESMSDDGVVRVTNAVAQLIKDGQGLLARVSGEVARRSPAEIGKDGLAKKQGFMNAARFVASATGGALSEAHRMVSVGKATAARPTLTGELLPPKHPHVAQALETGSLSVDGAALITGMLDRVSYRADADLSDAVEKALVEHGVDVPNDSLRRMVREAEARLDPDGVEPREEELREDRAVHVWENSRGMVCINAKLDPESGAPVKAALEGAVTMMLRAKRDERGAKGATDGFMGAGSVLGDDERSIPQMQADALAMMARHMIGCDQAPAPSTALVVRMDLEALKDGVGYGMFDGLEQPVSASTVRKMAASAEIIPMVLGCDSLPLDVGRAARGFTRAQRIALLERDGGCACCGITAPYVEAHHILWWLRDKGRTDLSNGVMLCPSCHTRIHADGWIITVDERQRVWFTPPPHVDVEQKPRLGGKARFGLPRTTAA